MKIVHLIPYFSYGGAEIFVKELVKKQSNDKNIKFEVWCLEKSINKELEEKIVLELKIKGINVKFITNKKNRKDRIINLKRLIQKEKPNIINTHLIHTTFYAVLCKVLSKKNTIIYETIHNTKIEKKWIQKILTKYFTQKTVVISEKIEEILIKDLGIDSKKLELIENGISMEFNKKYEVKDNIKKIICVGRLSEQKNHIFLLKLYKFLKDKNIKNIPILEIYGEGELRETLNQFIIKNELQEIIKLMGVTNNVNQKLLEADLYIMPSKYEGLSISLLEAMGIGIPIVASKVDGIKDILFEDIFEDILIEDDNIQDFYEKIINLFNNKKLREELSKFELEKVKKYSIEETAKKYNFMYKKIFENI